MMDPFPTALCYIAALVCWLIATVMVPPTAAGRPLNLVALGLAFYVLPLLWAAVSAA